MQRLPFMIALAVSAVLLAAAVEAAPSADGRTTEVDELSQLHDTELPATVLEDADLEVVEYGFGIVEDPQGGQRISLGAIIRNPSENEVYVESLELSGVGQEGATLQLDKFYVGSVPPGSEVTMGLVLVPRPEGLELDSLELEIGQASTVEQDPQGDLWFETHARPEMTVLGIEPLVAPEGHRLTYEVTVESEDEYVSYSIAVIFRDEQGEIVGGFPVVSEPFTYMEGSFETKRFPAGTSVQHVDLPDELIPANADPSKTEIGIGV